MTHIVSGITTKQELKERLKNNDRLSAIFFREDSTFNPRSMNAFDFPVGYTLYVTNHPRRTWFACIHRGRAGFIIK